MDPDFLLVQKMRMGDEKAIDAFVEKYYPRMLRYCQLHIDDAGYAEDLTQETFIRFFRTLAQYQHYGKAANYLYVIAANICRDYYRKNSARKKKEIPLEELPDSPAPQVEDPEQMMDVRQALEALPEEMREVAVLFFLQERKQKDIAKILGIGLPLVKYRIRKIREYFSTYFEKEDL